MNEGKTLYELLTNIECDYKFCILNMGPASVAFIADDVCVNNRFRETSIIATEMPNLSFQLHDSVLFKKKKENEEWTHYEDCNNLGYQLSFQK